MTYKAGDPIEAAHYNSFVKTINEIYSDLHSGETVPGPNGAQYGYGAAANLPNVSIGQAVTAAQWTGLLDRIRLCATHQATFSPLPPLVNIGDIIYALTELIATINNLYNNALILSTDPSQRATFVVNDQSTTPWTTQRTFTWQVGFSNWDDARHFFNSGGYLTIAGNINNPNPTPVDSFWIMMLANMGTVGLRAMDLSPPTTSPITPPFTGGFYNLTNTYKEIWRKVPSGGGGYYYTGSYISLRAKTNAVPGTNGLIDFQIILNDADITPDAKTGTMTFTHGYIKSAGAIPYTPPIATPSGSFT